VIELATTLFGHVVIDTGSGLDEHTLTAVEHSTDVIIISDMDVPSVRNVRKALDTLDFLGLKDHRRYLVLNRADSRVGLKKDDVQAAASMPIDLEIPSSRSVPQSINDGRPIITNSPRSAVARRIWSLVEELSSVGERHATEKGQ
jgi:pilus assembly protein CpaE